MGCMSCLYFFRLATSVCRYNYGNSELNFAISGLRGLAIWRDRLAKIAELSRTVSSMKADRDAEVARLGRGRANSAKHRGVFRAEETGRQKVTSASYQTYCHARTITITITAVIKLISAHKLSVRLWPLWWLCIVMGDDLPSGCQPPLLN